MKMMNAVLVSKLSDYADWLELAKEVEPLFGPMVDDTAFCDGLKQAIREGRAFCASEPDEDGRSMFHGGIVISKDANEILWLAVSGDFRGRGAGAALLSETVGRLDRNRPIIVTTFDRTIPAASRQEGSISGSDSTDSAAQAESGRYSNITMTLAMRSDGSRCLQPRRAGRSR